MHNRAYPALPYSDDPKVEYRNLKKEYEKLEKDYARKAQESALMPPLTPFPEDPQEAYSALYHLKEELNLRHEVPIEHMYDTLHECHATLQAERAEKINPYQRLLAIRSENRITIPGLLPLAVFLDTILSRSGSSSSHHYFLQTIVKPPELEHHQRENCKAILDRMGGNKDEAKPQSLEEGVNKAVNRLASCAREVIAFKADIASTLLGHGMFAEGCQLILGYMDDRSPTEVAKEVLLGGGHPYNEKKEFEVSDDEDERFGNGNQTLGRSLLMSMTR